MRYWQYKIVQEQPTDKVEEQLNQLGKEGWRVITCVWTADAHIHYAPIWTLEREIPTDTPYRG